LPREALCREKGISPRASGKIESNKELEITIIGVEITWKKSGSSDKRLREKRVFPRYGIFLMS